MTLCIIANPHSGNRSAKEVIKRLKNKLNQEIAVFLTRYPDDEENQFLAVMVPYPKFYISYQQIFHSLIIQWGQGMILRVPLD